MCDLRNATPYLFEVSGDDWLANHALGEEVFGPLGLIVRVRDFDWDTVVDEVIAEPFGGAHNDPAQAAATLKYSIQKHLNDLRALSVARLVDSRYERYRRHCCRPRSG